MFPFNPYNNLREFNMEMINKDAKSLLAKMLATENIHVVHKKMPTAYFDTKNRELGLPILKEMNGDIFDMMSLHLSLIHI